MAVCSLSLCSFPGNCVGLWLFDNGLHKPLVEHSRPNGGSIRGKLGSILLAGSGAGEVTGLF